MIKKWLIALKLRFIKIIYFIITFLKNKLFNLVDLLDDIKVVKAFAYVNLIIMFLNFVSYFMPYKLIIINFSFHYWFFIFSSVIILRYTQKNWNNL
jgi:hypothetical protein